MNRRLRAPTEDGELLADPPLEEYERLVDGNRRLLEEGRGTCLDWPWGDLRRWARETLLGDVGESPSRADEPLLLAGHQPELFHPGVWVKNFVLHGRARRLGSCAVNLVIDSDLVKSTSLLIPTTDVLEAERPRPMSIGFDGWQDGVAWEERRVVDRERFESFGTRVGELIRAWGFAPLIEKIWPGVVEQTRGGATLGEAFASARRSVERRWEGDNNEVAWSRVCSSEPFGVFVCALLADAEAFRQTYNRIVREYRAKHRIRSESHPVPELTKDGDWVEVPFWGWTSGERRSPLFVRGSGDRLDFCVGGREWPGLPHPSRHSSERVLDSWRELGGSGYKVRTRALVTTLYSRLFLGDLFLHGIGGGKYDELTDRLFLDYLRMKPPEYAVVSGTFLLPVPRTGRNPDDRLELTQRCRAVRYNPQRYLDSTEELEVLLGRKWEWIRTEPETREGRRARCRALKDIAARVGECVRPEVERLQGRLAKVERELELDTVLGRRDYSFCLYPEQSLRPLIERFL